MARKIEKRKMMHSLERRRRILELLRTESFLTVERVQDLLNSSPATTRRDFSILAEQMMVVRGHGGIHRLDDAPVMGVVPYSRRSVTNNQGKERIAADAAQLLGPNDVVIIDGGTTTAPLARHISALVRVITNSLPLASALNEPINDKTPIPEVNVTGGYLYPKSEVLLGPQTVQALKQYHANWAFLGCDGVTTEAILNSNSLVIETQREMMNRAEKVAILADHSKFGKTAMVRLCELREIDAIITDKRPSKELEAALREAQVQLIVARD
jgi:DeoR/GlpR family transcriptional regulator of sugar metabolism